ncbi:hypothetical protein [Xanthomonas sp. MUS 060]|uniref:hypothetical protein n=1 Tax=Xanthomonas sp. MUS 060 TaxID=1588031 RepID=UPI0005F2A174|nr:hypothetical protein [Xanthomonas sp. MUS 060]
MSGQILHFPFQDSYDKYQALHVRQLARDMGIDPKQAERDFLASANLKQQRAEMSEQARRARMQKAMGARNG